MFRINIGSTESVDNSYSKNKRIFLDTEFWEVGGHVRLISLGMVDQNNNELYILPPNIGEVKELASKDPDRWVFENVLADEALYAYEPVETSSWEEMQAIVTKFCGESPIFWAYIASYDKVALSNVYGRMINCPSDWPYAIMDLAVPLALAGLRSKDFSPKTELGELPEHCCLADARWNKRVWSELSEMAMANSLINSNIISKVLVLQPR